MNNQEHIEKVITNTFAVIQEVYDYQKKGGEVFLTSSKRSRLIFPEKRDGTLRISEQELRFIFVEQLNQEINTGWNVFYSVETPTSDTYCFDGIPRPDETGRSAQFDLVIHDENFKRIALIEFKANNADEHDHYKDFVKLNNSIESDENTLRYLIEILKNADQGTLKSLHDKTKGNEDIFRCYSLDKGSEITKAILSYSE